MANACNKALHTGATNDLMRRVDEHKHNLIEGFTAKYNVHKLVYYECTTEIEEAIKREKQKKAGHELKR